MIILAHRWRTRLSLDDLLVRLKRLMPQLSRSALYRCLERHGLSKIGRTNVSPPLTSAILAGPTVLKSPLMMWPCPATSSAFRSSSPSRRSPNTLMGRWLKLTPENTAAFLARLVAEFPQKIDAVTTAIRPAFAHLREAFGEGKPEMHPDPFAVACSAKGIVHKRTLLLS